jgi:hypothetical protein
MYNVSLKNPSIVETEGRKEGKKERRKERKKERK